MTAALVVIAVLSFAFGALAGWSAHGLRQTLKESHES